MKLICMILALCMLPISAGAEIVDLRMKDEFDAKLEAKRAVDGSPTASRDEDKFSDAAKRREERRQDALDERRKKNAKKSHVYPLSIAVALPTHSRPFLWQPNPNGGVLVGGGANPSGSFASRKMSRDGEITNRLTILFLLDENAMAYGPKPSHLKQNGHVVITPPLPQNFQAAVRAAEFALNKYRPDVIVGDSRGGAVAINMNSGQTPLVLLSPAWKDWGEATTVKQSTIILHSPADRVIPFAASEELRSSSDLPNTSLVQVGQDHRLADPASLRVLLQACERLGPGS